jgi:hypothetical protein
MSFLSTQVGLARLVAVVATGTFLSGCMTWQTQSLQPERFNSADSTRKVRLTLTSGDTLIVHGPVITGDSLVGMQTRRASPDSPYYRVSIPLTAISEAQIWENDAGATAALGILGLVAVVAIIAASHPCYGICTH